MAEEEQDAQIREAAEKRVAEVLGFRHHLTMYLAVNGFLFVVWLVLALVFKGGAWFPWFLFPLVGWGIGISSHAFAVYGSGNSRGKRDAMVAKEMERMKKDQPR